MVDVAVLISLRNEVIPDGSIVLFYDLKTTGLNITSEIV